MGTLAYILNFGFKNSYHCIKYNLIKISSAGRGQAPTVLERVVIAVSSSRVVICKATFTAKRGKERETNSKTRVSTETRS